ncbi:MAG: ribosome-associated translation inhibitor RaiA [Bacteroidales bacterium]|nr:ribosome-associated translation inhibitor RaiA [Bacteroidales bacterium]MCF8343636.1 ribosome-associated translation inhibitor RaiA [Bacteroidales bacterium]MCF8375184.1 ribosome-associated translation inhibitor RaiA [Bacteroidales bacterium]MCF8400694.1 ribosome-associated translation inhibitor RaiA [Bacteroidales bacterium]
MQVNISSVHFKADKKLLAYIKEKVEKLSQFYDGVLGSDVTLKLENSGSRENKLAEIKLFIKGDDLFAKKASKSFEEATDNSVEALRRQLKKYKGKIVDKNR